MFPMTADPRLPSLVEASAGTEVSPNPRGLMRLSIRTIGLVAAPLATAALFSTAIPQTASGATYVPTYARTYASLPDGTKQVVRWNGCQGAITYKVNLAAVPSSLRATVLAETKTAVANVAASTQFVFSYKGTTSEVPRVGSMPKQTAELVIAYTSPSMTNHPLYGSTLGQGGLYYGWVSRTASGRTTYTVAALRGFVVIDTPQMLTQAGGGYGTGLRRSNLVAHELGHAIGLQHVSDTRQQMYPVIRTASPKLFYSGDRAGLARVGKSAGCINTAYMPVKDLS